MGFAHPKVIAKQRRINELERNIFKVGIKRIYPTCVRLGSL